MSDIVQYVIYVYITVTITWMIDKKNTYIIKTGRENMYILYMDIHTFIHVKNEILSILVSVSIADTLHHHMNHTTVL